MKTLAVILFLLLFCSSQALAGFEMLVVTTGSAVPISSSTKCSSTAHIECTVGPVKTNAIVVTWGSPVVTPTATSGHELAAGSSLTLKGNVMDSNNEPNSFRAIASSATSTVPVTCTCN